MNKYIKAMLIISILTMITSVLTLIITIVKI